MIVALLVVAAASRRRRRVPTLMVEVASVQRTRVQIVALLRCLAAALDMRVLATFVDVAKIDCAHVVVITVFVVDTAVRNLHVHALVELKIAAVDAAEVGGLTLGVVGTASFSLHVLTLILQTAILCA